MPLERNDNFTLSNQTGSDVPDLSFALIKDSILGKKYDLSLVFVGEAAAKKLNIAYRQKDYIPDILSFPLSDDAGEIFICQKAAMRKMKEFDDSRNESDYEFGGNFSNFLGFLFIHGLLHLNGMEHGSTMDKAEWKFSQKFGFSSQKWQKKKQPSA